MKIRGLGPKKVKILLKELGIDSLDKLREAVDGQKIRELRGFGETTELTGGEHIVAGLTIFEPGESSSRPKA